MYTLSYHGDLNYALQLDDPSFRRQIILQAIIFCHFLLLFTESQSAKTIWAGLTNRPAWLEAILQQRLSTEDEAWTRQTIRVLVQELRDMGGKDQGSAFAAAGANVVARERNWVGCQFRWIV